MFRNYLFLILSLLMGYSQAQVYVDHQANGLNDGSSWANAYTDLQSALDNATSGSDIWVATGEYKPSGPSADSTYFVVDKPINLYGGFTSGGTMTSRNWQTNPTRLNGDVLGDDVPGNFTTNRSDNAIHVLWVKPHTGNTIIDGFVIQGGANRMTTPPSNPPNVEELYLYSGAGIFLEAKAEVRFCEIRDNIGYWGSALYSRSNTSDSVELKVHECIITRNEAVRGVVRLLRINGPIIEHTTFSHNHATLNAGAVYTVNTSLELRFCEFRQNIGDYSGGAVFVLNNDDPNNLTPLTHITGCRFEEMRQGGMAVQQYVITTESLEENA